MRNDASALPPEPQRRWELLAWSFMRWSGLALLLLAGIHLLIMHDNPAAAPIDRAFITTRWQAPGWRLYDGILLALAVIHGANGVRIVGEDHAPLHRRGLVRKVVVAAAALLLGAGATTLLLFPFA